MQKDFEKWSERKREVNNLGTYALYHQREVWWCILGTNIGFEQDGRGTGFERPVLVLKGFSAYVCLVIPLTTSKKVNPYHVPIGMIAGKEAFAIISQLRLIDTKRLVEKIEYVPIDVFKVIQKAVRDLF